MVEGRELVRCEGLRVGYREAILPPIDVTIREGEIWVVIGRNGSGKTTWFKTMLGLAPPIDGKVVRSDPGLHLSYVPQRTAYDDLFPLLSRDVVSMGAERGGSFLVPRLRERPEVMDALREVNAAELADRPFRQLSEGQKQRVLLARLSASRPQMALLDEPTAAMDVVAEGDAFEHLDRIRQDSGMAIIVVSHFLGIARKHADRAVFFDRDTQTVVVGDPDEIMESHAFRRSFGHSGAFAVP